MEAIGGIQVSVSGLATKAQTSCIALGEQMERRIASVEAATRAQDERIAVPEDKANRLEELPGIMWS
eukprot:2833792-Pyramimonas_sp.AAC.1